MITSGKPATNKSEKSTELKNEIVERKNSENYILRNCLNFGSKSYSFSPNIAL